MREFPQGGLIGRSVRLYRWVKGMRVQLYAANACFFLVLAVFPALLLLLGLLRYTPLAVERLSELVAGILPGALAEGAEEIILLTYDNASGGYLGISALAALWSAGRGIHGMMTGLNAIYGATEDRGYLRTRLLSALYTLVFLLMVLLTLALHIFGTGLLEWIALAEHPFWRFAGRIIDFRFWLLLILQTMLFTAMFLALPNGHYGIWESVPGAALASVGWLGFSRLFSVYVEHFAGLRNVYGSLYAVPLGMLWLYFCVSIVFYGGVLNVFLRKREKL